MEWMKTNTKIEKDNHLYDLGQTLIEAGYAFWQEHQKVHGSNAVVWLDTATGMFLLFTRGEYKKSIMANLGIDLDHEKPLTDSDWTKGKGEWDGRPGLPTHYECSKCQSEVPVKEGCPRCRKAKPPVDRPIKGERECRT